MNNMDKGWIKLHRKMTDWEWYNDEKTFKLFIHLLLTVNYEEKKWMGINIKKGQIITSYGHLASQLNYGVQSIRTSLDKLKSTHELTIKTTNKNTIITILKWNNYQQITSKSTNEQQSTNNQLTTTKELKERKNNNPVKTGEKTMQTINYDTGEIEEEPKKTNKSKEYIRLARMFDKLASDYTGKPIITPKSYFIVANAIKNHKLSIKGIEVLYESWFSDTKIKTEDKVKMSFCLSASNINSFKVKN